MRMPFAAVSVDALPPLADPGWACRLSAAELAYCAGRRRAGEHLAARLLGRLVVAEALGWPGPPRWTEITIRRSGSGQPTVVLSGEMERWRSAAGLAVPGVSISHAAGHATALAWVPSGTASDGPHDGRSRP